MAVWSLTIDRNMVSLSFLFFSFLLSASEFSALEGAVASE